MAEPFTDEEFAIIEAALSEDAPPLFDRDYRLAAQRLLVGCRQYRADLIHLRPLDYGKPAICPHCNATVDAGHNFCQQCGHRCRLTCGWCCQPLPERGR